MTTAETMATIKNRDEVMTTPFSADQTTSKNQDRVGFEPTELRPRRKGLRSSVGDDTEMPRVFNAIIVPPMFGGYATADTGLHDRKLQCESE
jgi:hypothetical protein